jgi:hypothetical protein
LSAARQQIFSNESQWVHADTTAVRRYTAEMVCTIAAPQRYKAAMAIVFEMEEAVTDAQVIKQYTADARRLLNVYVNLQSRLPQFRQYIVASGQSYDNAQKQIQISIKAVQHEIKAACH